MRILSGTQPNGVLRIGNQIDAAAIFARGDFVNVHEMHSGWLQRLALWLATDVVRTVVLAPVCQGLLKVGSRQVLGQPDQILLRVLYTVVVSQRSDLMKEIFEEESRLNLAQLKLELLGEKASNGMDYFLLLFLGDR